MKKKFEFEVKNKELLLDFLNKCKNVENSLLININNEKFTANTYTPDHTIVKHVELSMEDLFSEIPKGFENIKVGIYLIDRLINSIKGFDGEFDMIVRTDLVDGEVVATGVDLKDEDLVIKLKTAPLSMFEKLTDEKVKLISETEGNLFEFLFTKENFSKLQSLLKIDSSIVKLFFKQNENDISLKTENFNLVVENNGGGEHEVFINKDYVSYWDKEDCDFYVMDTKLIIKGKETDTITIIGISE